MWDLLLDVLFELLPRKVRIGCVILMIVLLVVILVVWAAQPTCCAAETVTNATAEQGAG